MARRADASRTARPSLLQRLRESRRQAASVSQWLGWVGMYLALRGWSTLMNCFPIETNLRSAALLGRIWWRLRSKHRGIALENLRHALGDRCSDDQLQEIARRSFEYVAQLYLVEFMMTPRLITEWSWARHVELGNLAPALRRLIEQQPTILLTAHFGNFELLGFTISRLGMPLHAVMRPLDNPLANDFLMRTREAGGLHLLLKKGAAEQFHEILRTGGALSFIADQDAGRKGVFADFFGRPASWYKSIGLLAMHARVPIVVGYAARIGPGFRYRIEIDRIIQPEEWEQQPDPLRWVTQTYAASLERCIRRYPEQYLWIHRRWKSQPGAATGNG